MNEIEALVKISKYAGERFDLIQAGGGNSSVKLNDGTMLIKASGFSLSNVEKDKGYSKVNTRQIASIVEKESILNSKNKRERENLASFYVKKATLDKSNRPSIETLLHSLVHKYTLHSHPITANIILSRKDWRDVVGSLFGETVATVEYKTPGIELALDLNREISRLGAIPKIIFLQNHGLIITSNNISDIQLLTDSVLDKIARYLNIDMQKYKMTNSISSLMRRLKNNTNISYLCRDIDINNCFKHQKEIFFKKPFCPDSLVYCGVSGVEINDLNDVENIKKYQKIYHEMPKVIIYNELIFLHAQNIKKAKEIEDVLKFHILILSKNIKKINYLNLNELAYLSNWEAELYRKNNE